MKTFKAINKPASFSAEKINNCFASLQSLIDEAEEKIVPLATVDKINSKLDELNSLHTDENKYYKKLVRAQRDIVNILAKEAKLTTRGYYRTLWTALGMPGFGLPLGTAISLSLNNLALLAIGLPFGFLIGMAIGQKMDKDAAAKGRLLDTDIVFK